jgi:hypothetical protein
MCPRFLRGRTETGTGPKTGTSFAQHLLYLGSRSANLYQGGKTMSNQQPAHRQRDAAHAHPIDPVAFVFQGTGPTQVPTAARLPPAAEALPDTEPSRLQEIMAQIKDLAQKVGGTKRLLELVQTLDQTRE